MKKSCFLLAMMLLLPIDSFAKANEHFDYKHQDEWVFVSGDQQSPINIDTSKVAKLRDNGKIFLKYAKAVTYDENNGHSIQVGDNGIAIIYGREFSLEQFHFHVPSEHSFDGKHYAMEVHFVNKSRSGRIAVIGVLFKVGQKNQGFQDVLDNISDTSGTGEINIDVDAMIPEDKSYYHYLGSLTTPPLRENVEWYVLSHVMEVSQEQLDTFHKYYDGNNRSIQPTGDRVILEYVE